MATALAVNLLTEDNLPSYHFEIAVLFGRDGAWGEWVHRWTAEEGRHGQAIRDYLLVTRACDPIALERERMVHMADGFVNIHGHDPIHSIAYVSFQELATRVSHRNVGRATERPRRRGAVRAHRDRREPAHGLLPDAARGVPGARRPTGRCARSPTS